MNSNFIILVFFIIQTTKSTNPNDNGEQQQQQQQNRTTFIIKNETTFDRFSLAYGLLLDTNCETDDDCIIKNSICNTNTKRCDCDYNAIHSDNRCRTLQCHKTQDCSEHFGNTICVFGTCRCRWGLKANGKCVDIDVPVIGSQSLPDWAISLIAIVALLSGIWGGRSPFVSQLSRQLLSILVLVIGRFATNQQQQQQQNPQQPSSSLLIDELQSAMIQMNNQRNSSINNDENDQQQQQQRKPKLSSANILDELVSLAKQSNQFQEQQQQQQQQLQQTEQ
ncbi:uncharacterized protein LOC113792256 [Dermatophagoides pteronyssinus]|uniref:uncharacterized protein LOC113792256 n=1 Tax=Dermatophagoides pteronyssinus TaxID=6956 RepID=UPI003F680169